VGIESPSGPDSPAVPFLSLENAIQSGEVTKEDVEAKDWKTWDPES